MNQSKERERFEAWFANNFPATSLARTFPPSDDLQGRTGYYSEKKAFYAWQAWQAAKADVEPVLDSARGVVNTEDGYLESLFDAVDDLTNKLEAYDEGTPEHVNQ